MAEPPPPSSPLRRPDPDVPPPPPGTWPLAGHHGGPAGPSTAGVGAVRGPQVAVAGLGLSFAAIAVYLLGQLVIQLVAALVLVGAGVLDPTVLDPEAGGVELLTIVLVSQVAGLLGVLALLSRRSVRLRTVVGAMRPVGRHLAVGSGLGLLTVVVALTVVSVLVALTGSDEAPDQLLTGELLGTPSGLVLSILIAVVLAPLAEELLFRGLLHRGLRRRLRIVPATMISSVLFALVHVDVVFSQPIALIGLTLAGAVMAVAYERTGSLLVPIVIHAVYNATTLVALVAVARFDIDPSASVIHILVPAVAG